jgi:hypothetical protein
MDNSAKKFLNILQWNASMECILPKKHFMQNLLQRHDIDICESWLYEGVSFSLQGYNIIRNERQDGYGGIMLAIHRDLEFEVVRLPSSNRTEIELLALNLRLHSNDQKLQITVAYDGT